MDEASRKDVIDYLYFTIGCHFSDFWPLGFGFIPRFANLAGISSCIWYLAFTFLPRSTLVTEIQARTSREIGQHAHKKSIGVVTLIPELQNWPAITFAESAE